MTQATLPDKLKCPGKTIHRLIAGSMLVGEAAWTCEAGLAADADGKVWLSDVCTLRDVQRIGSVDYADPLNSLLVCYTEDGFDVTVFPDSDHRYPTWGESKCGEGTEFNIPVRAIKVIRL